LGICTTPYLPPHTGCPIWERRRVVLQPLAERLMLSRAPKDAAEEFRAAIETNAIGNMVLYQAFVPLILQGQVKKVISITTGMADVDFISQYGVESGGLYSASKGALNVINAKFSAQYKRQGVLFLGISPGVIDTGYFTPDKSKSPQPSLSFYPLRNPSNIILRV